MKAPDSAMPAGLSATSQKPAALPRIRVLPSSGLGCWLPPEYGAALQRILQLKMKAKIIDATRGLKKFSAVVKLST